MYIRRHRGELILTVEHRGAPAPEPITLLLAADDNVHLQLATGDGDDGGAIGQPRDAVDLDQAILQALALAPGPITRSELRARLRVRNERLGEALVRVRLTEAGAAVRVGDRFRIPDSRHP